MKRTIAPALALTAMSGLLAVSTAAHIMDEGRPDNIANGPTAAEPNTTRADRSPAIVRGKGILRGINLSGGEFGRGPGRLNKNYRYPGVDEVDFFRQQGFRLIRVPFRWERLQPKPGGPLVEQDRAALRALVTRATRQGIIVVLDLHNYAARQVDGRLERIGTSSVGASQLADIWIRLIADFRDNDRVWIGLMNEPNGVDAQQWWAVAQETVNILRAKGVRQRILVPGTSWTGAHSWKRVGNAAQAEKFVDPAHNMAFEVHQYLDKDSSGTSGECAVGAARRIDGVIDWARQHHVTLFMGEMAAGDTPQCAIEYRALLTSIEGSGVFVGWAAWGAGSWWSPDYPFRLTPKGWPKTSTPTQHLRQLQAFMRDNPGPD